MPTAEQRAQAQAAIAAHRRSGSRPSSQQSKGSAPWDGGKKASVLPRNTRIASTMPINFWARGKNHEATAQNFSAEGVFLASRTDPPVRGAIVRVEFPLEGDGESAPIRFNAEVRWHRSDRPGAGLPEGFGVQILTFESPKDRARYEELCSLLLSIQPASESEGGHHFSWGKK